MNDYIESLIKLLGKEKYNELYDSISSKAYKIYERGKNGKINDIIQYNLAVVLIVGVEKGRGCSNVKIAKIIKWHSIGDKSQLIYDNLSDFIKEYDEYIKIVKNVVVKRKDKVNRMLKS